MCGLVACTNFGSEQTKEKVSKPEEIAKFNYTIDLHVWHRRNAYTAQSWTKIKNHAQVHYFKHKVVPMFRLFHIDLNTKDSSFEYSIGNAILKTYCKDLLIETNASRTFGGSLKFLYSGQKGLLDCTDKEQLRFYVFYRKVGDSLSVFKVDTLNYEIIMDQEEVGLLVRSGS